MADCVLDASAILAILFDEPGREIAMTAAGDAAVSALTVAEVATRLIDTGQSLPGIAEIVAEFELRSMQWAATRRSTLRAFATRRVGPDYRWATGVALHWRSASACRRSPPTVHGPESPTSSASRSV